MGVIEESHSAWASLIVLVNKPDGAIRFCVDYRKVNSVSKFDAYPMPWVDDLLDRLGTSRFFPTLDLNKGYWQIPFSPESKEKSAFSTPYGLYQFKTLRPQYAAAYLDDMIIHSDTWPQQLCRVVVVLELLTANQKKCVIGWKHASSVCWLLGEAPPDGKCILVLKRIVVV